MTKTTPGSSPDSHGDTAAAGYHLSDTIEWSSLSARIKNRVIVKRVTVTPQRSTRQPRQQETKRG